MASLCKEDEAPSVLAIADREPMMAIEDGIPDASTVAIAAPSLADFPIFARLKRRREGRALEAGVLI